MIVFTWRRFGRKKYSQRKNSPGHHNQIPLPWDHYGYRAVTFTLGITSRLERVFYLRCQKVDPATIPCLIRLTGMNWWRLANPAR